MTVSRRAFLSTTLLAGVSLDKWSSVPLYFPASGLLSQDFSLIAPDVLLSLEPAKWIWHNGGRTLPNSFFIFKCRLHLEKEAEICTGWIVAESRYKLYVNGNYVQFGPAPNDPRYVECDPLDAMKPFLKKGDNIIEVLVCYFGYGDGTMPVNKPGFLFQATIDGKQVLSGEEWRVHYARCWKPGQYKRWFLRSLQEEYDARIRPAENSQAFDSLSWKKPLVSKASAAKPSLCNDFDDYQNEIYYSLPDAVLLKRSVPMLREELVKSKGITEHFTIHWNALPEECFELNLNDAATKGQDFVYDSSSTDTIKFTAEKEQTYTLFYEWKEQVVGFPVFSIQASAGTIVECLFHEAHRPGNAVLMNTHCHSWARFICKEGNNNFETFDFESLRWMQIIVRNTSGAVVLKEVAVRRRLYPYSNSPQINVSLDWLQVLLNACVNTLYNCAQDTIVDGMARERQQYSGDGSHQLHAIYQSFGEYRLPARFVNTFGKGMNSTGVFFHSWPAWDVLARTWERQLSLTEWGNLVDHSIGFCFDVWYYYLYTGDELPVKAVYPNLLQFFTFLEQQAGGEKILPINTGGIPAVWIDHEAYQQKRHKQCAYNLYAAAMLKHALAPIADIMHDQEISERSKQLSAAILQSTTKQFWSSTHHAFVVNRPWLSEEKNPRYCDRSLATALLFDMNPKNDNSQSLQVLQSPTKELGLSYPCNAIWRCWALAKHGRMEAILDDFKTRWFSMLSVKENNTIQEFWQTKHDSTGQWSHCAVAPLIILNQYILGVQPRNPLTKEIIVTPQLSQLDQVNCMVYMYGQGIRFELVTKEKSKTVFITVPKGIKAILNPQYMKLISYNGETTSLMKEIELQQEFRNALEFRKTK